MSTTSLLLFLILVVLLGGGAALAGPPFSAAIWLVLEVLLLVVLVFVLMALARMLSETANSTKELSLFIISLLGYVRDHPRESARVAGRAALGVAILPVYIMRRGSRRIRAAKGLDRVSEIIATAMFTVFATTVWGLAAVFCYLAILGRL